MNVLIIAGSNRRNAASTRLCRYMEKLIREAGHAVRLFALYEHPLPLYSPETEDCADPHAIALKQAAREAEAFILATPEYHGTVSGVLKNALDYLGSDHFAGKTVLSCCSSGGAVGISSLQNLQTIVRNVHGVNCPEWISLGGENRKFTPDGEPENPKIRERVLRTVEIFLGMAEALNRLHSQER